MGERRTVEQWCELLATGEYAPEAEITIAGLIEDLEVARAERDALAAQATDLPVLGYVLVLDPEGQWLVRPHPTFSSADDARAYAAKESAGRQWYPVAAGGVFLLG